MEKDMQEKAVRLITENILTPVIYMLENEEQAEFVCFCDTNTEPEVFVRTENMLFELLGRDITIFDIREYSAADRIKIIEEAELIYTANPVFERIFEMSMSEDYRRMETEKINLIRRYDEQGTIYLQ